jgi:hypothetical protein
MQELLNAFHLGTLSDSTLLLLGFLVGLIAKNLSTILLRSFGFAGGFASRLAIGWWEEFRRETPNVIDFVMVAVADCERQKVLLMDPLIGPRRLSDVYLNPRTAFGVRMQTFSISADRPWVSFKIDPHPPLTVRLFRWYNRLRRSAPHEPMSPRDRQLLRIRRTYGPIESLVGQYMTNDWSAQMAIGEPCHIFHFVVALIYDLNADRHMDRHFHVLVIWEEVLRSDQLDDVVCYHPEFNRRWDIIKQISAHYRASPEAHAEFGTISVMIPKRTLINPYDSHWVLNADGRKIPISRPAEPETT